ncbi:hypothetical protein AB0A69_10490 [Streptomyces sp. NPDC045431]|uniref:hypothetical protein n=1 Tax=Streptomyces sp. NPDC045431 TaxID=3155613 RepID=UPI0033C262D1
MGAALFVLGSAGAASADTFVPGAPPAEVGQTVTDIAGFVRAVITDVVPSFKDVHDWG